MKLSFLLALVLVFLTTTACDFPVTYSVNGKQYIAVTAGWGGWLKGFAPNLIGAPRGDALFVFALP